MQSLNDTRQTKSARQTGQQNRPQESARSAGSRRPYCPSQRLCSTLRPISCFGDAVRQDQRENFAIEGSQGCKGYEPSGNVDHFGQTRRGKGCTDGCTATYTSLLQQCRSTSYATLATVDFTSNTSNHNVLVKLQTAWNLQQRLQGQCQENPPLNATGEQQAQAVSPVPGQCCCNI